MNQLYKIKNENYDEFWMHQAILFSKYAEVIGEIPIGAVLILNNKIIGAGWNCSIEQNDPTAHAEIIALRQGGQIINNYRLPQTTLYVIKEPCIMCAGAIINARVHRLVLGIKNHETDFKKSLTDIISDKIINHKVLLTTGILEKECSQQIKNFFCKKRINKKNNNLYY